MSNNKELIYQQQIYRDTAFCFADTLEVSLNLPLAENGLNNLKQNTQAKVKKQKPETSLKVIRIWKPSSPRPQLFYLSLILTLIFISNLFSISQSSQVINIVQFQAKNLKKQEQITLKKLENFEKKQKILIQKTNENLAAEIKKIVYKN